MAWGVPKIGATAEALGGDLTLTEPAGVAQNHLMVACIAYRDVAAFTLPSGWALVATQQSSGDTDATNGIASGLMAYIVRGASAPSLVFTRTGGNIALGRIISYSGGSLTPYDTGSANTLAVESTTFTTGTITTSLAEELIVAMTAAGDEPDAASAFDAATDPTTASGAIDTTTAPTNGTWIQRADSSTATGADTALAIADAIRATAGATGTIQATSAGGSRGVMIAAAFKIATVLTPVSLSVAGAAVVALSKVALYKRALATSAVSVSALSKYLSMFRTLSTTAVGVPALARFVSVFKTLSASAVTVAALDKVRTYSRALSAATVTVASLATQALYIRALAATVTTVAALTRFSIRFKTLTATAGISVAMFTKGVALVLRNAAGALVANTLVKWGIMEYGGGTPSDANWMSVSDKGTDWTDGSGNLQVPYSGASAKGATVYVAVVHPDDTPTESMIWTDSVK